MAINIPVNAQLNQQDITGQVKQIQAAFNDLGKTAQAAGRIKFAPISKMTVDDAKRMRQEFETMVKLSPGLRNTLKQAGQGGLPFDQVDWDKVWTNPAQRGAHAQTMVSYLSPDQIKAKFGRGPRAGVDEDEPQAPRRGRSMQRAAMGAIAGAAGGVASQVGGLAGGMASGALAGGLTGGLPGAALGAMTGAISSLLGSIGEARDIAISLDQLKRNLGDVNVSFKDLQGSTRTLADEYSLNDSEAVALTGRYAHLAGSGKNPEAIRQEVGVGVGFSRAFGLDPSAGVDFFGQMKGLGVTRDSDDQKRLALMIGESVAKAGALPKMADVLAGLSTYLEASGRSLNETGPAQWLAHLAGLEQTGLPGMNPKNAANIISTIDGSIRQGGTTEAGKNFMSGVLQRDQDLSAIQAAVQLEGGAFATGRTTFGPDSAMSKFYERFGGGTRSAGSWGSDESNIALLQRQLLKEYQGKSPDLMLDAFHNTFGTGYAQSAAWLASNPAQNDGMIKRLQRLGIDWKSVNADGVSRLSQIEADTGLNDAQKDEQAKSAASQNMEKTEGSEARKAAVDGANAMVRLANEGLPLISSIQMAVLKMAGLDPVSVADKVVQSTHDKNLDDIRGGAVGKDLDESKAEYEAITPLAKRISGIGLTDEQQFAKDRYDAAKQDYDTAVNGEMVRWKGEREQLKRGEVPASAKAADPAAAPGPGARVQPEPSAQDDAVTAAPQIGGADQALVQMTPAEQADMEQGRRQAAADDSARSPGTVGRLPPDVLARAAESDRKAGLPPGTTAALIMQESSGNPMAVSRAGAKGPLQIMDSNTSAYSKQAGRQLNPFDFDDSFYMYDRLMAERRARYGGDVDKMLRSYNAGYDEDRWQNSETQDYVPAIERRRQQMQNAAQAQGGGTMQHKVAVDITMRDSAGRRLDDSVSINTRVGSPKASGVAA